MALDNLEEGSVQWEIAHDPNTHIRVLAGPGTGKSFGLQHRVARLLGDNVSPADILTVTFTRAAANALRNDLSQIGVAGAELIEARTLHSLCFRGLMREQTMFLTGRVPRPVLDFEREPLLHDLSDLHAGENYSGKRRKTKAIQGFESAWAQLQHEEPGWPSTDHETSFHNELTSWLRFHRAMLIGEVVPTMLSHLRNNPDSGPRFAHVLVDEYQDLNRAEQDLINELARDGAQLVIGDDDQSIYRFKFAHPEGVIEYVNRFDNVLPLETEICRRCPPLIVDMANALMSHQTQRLTERQLECHDPSKHQDVDIVRWPTVEAEARGVAQFIQAYLEQNPEVSPGNTLVLSPRRHIGYLVAEELTAIGRESRSYFQEQELDEFPAQSAFTLLRLLVDPTDRVSLRWWLGYGSHSWLSGTYARLHEHCASSGEAPHEALTRLANGDLSIPRTGRLVERWGDLQARLSELRDLLGLELVDALIPQGDEDTARLRAAALEVLTDDMPPTTLHEQLSEFIRGPEVPQESDVIRVMSLHKSKGLTADLVVIVGMTAGLVPFVREDTPEEELHQLEEQRRLFFVAVTRTRRALLLSSGRRMSTEFARKMGMYRVPRGYYFDSQASGFLDEISPPVPQALTPVQLAGKYGFAYP